MLDQCISQARLKAEWSKLKAEIQPILDRYVCDDATLDVAASFFVGMATNFLLDSFKTKLSPKQKHELTARLFNKLVDCAQQFEFEHSLKE